MQRLLILYLIFVTSCVSNHRDFHLYKTAPTQHAGKGSPIHGIYFLTDYKRGVHYYDPPLYFFLHDDGTVFTFNMNGTSSVADSEFWKTPEEYLRHVNYKVASGNGIFIIDNDRITIETIEFKGGIPQRGVNRFEGIIGVDSTIQFVTQICKWCPDRISDYPKNGIRTTEDFKYRFFQTSIRPDTADFWIKRTRWYRKGRNEQK